MRLLSILAVVSLALAARPPAPQLKPDAAPQSFVNTAVARTIELGGSTSQVTTQYNVKALVDSPGNYILALGAAHTPPPAWFEVSVGGVPSPRVEIASLLDTPVAIVPLPKLKAAETTTISVNTIATHASRAVPETIGQRDPQFMLWETNSTLVDSIYASDVERIKIRSPTPKIISHGRVPTTYTRDSDVTVSTSTVVLGPFHSVPPTVGPAAKAQQSPFFVHYETREPILGIRHLRRTAEVSHWGANLNIQDEISLFNDGPALSGQFSRLAHQQSRFHAAKPAQVLAEFALRLPPSAHSVYYYDVIGNVSTSHFRPGSPASPKRPRALDSVLELRPRYPVLGGWNYTFTMGWDAPLAEALKVAPGGRKILAVPFLTGLKGVVVDQEDLRIILPEGASVEAIYTPFPVDSEVVSVHKTYLDTTGRPVVEISKADVTERHALPVYVEYSVSTAAELRKPIAVASVAVSVLAAFIALRRVNYSIDRGVKAA